jgi:hypothetical protein
MTSNSLYADALSGTNPGFQHIISRNFNALHSSANYSALALLVATILADDTHHTLAPYDLAVTTDTLDRSAYFHVSSPSLKLEKRAAPSAQQTRTALAFQIGLLHQTAVLV